MAVPEFQTFILPVLKATADGNEHTLPEVRDQVAIVLGLTADDSSEMIPSGRKT